MAIILPIVSTFNTAGVKSAQSSLTGFGSVLSKVGAQVAVAAFAFKGLQGAINFANESVTQAKDLQRNLAALETVFGSLSGRMTTFSANAYKMGISQSDAARTATFLGSVLKQAGFEMVDVADETEKLTVLAQDLATTFGYDTSEALTAMTALFRGEYDPIEKFGVALKQDEVNSLLLAKGLGNLEGQEKLNAQQQVRLEQLYLRSADAAGAFAAQSGSLFVEQKKLNAVFDNMQATVGQELTPALAGLMGQLTPILEDLGPRLAETFSHVGDAITDLTPIIEPLGRLLNSVVDIFNILLEILDPVIRLLGVGLAVALDYLVELTDSLGRGIDDLVGYFNDLAEAVQFTNEAPMTSWLEEQIRVLAVYIPSLTAFVGLIDAVKGKVTEVTAKSNITSRSRLRGQRLDRLGVVTGVKKDEEKKEDKRIVVDTVAEYYKNLADEVSKQSAKLRLTNLGASEALIQSIIGSGDQWMKMFTKVNSSGKKGVAELQKTFNKTAAGLSEIKDAQEEAAKAAKALYDAAVERDAKLKAAYDEQVQTLKDYKDALKGIVAALQPLAVADRILGAFEQSAVEVFTNIATTIKEGLASGTLTADAAKSLSDYADKEKSVFAKIGKQRDELVAKRSLAEALIGEVRSAVTEFGNINALIDQQSNKVTSTVEKMVNGFKVTTSRTVDEVVGAGDMVSGFQKIVARTKAFATQLNELRALGLDPKLYKQIVDAGVEAGSVTAQEIIKGGAGTVGELNSLFGELNAVGADMAEQTAEVMLTAGSEIGSALVAGLLAEEQALVSTAEVLANAFITAFNGIMANFSVQMPAYEVGAATEQVAQVVGTSGLEKELADKLTNLRSRLTSLGAVEGAAEMATAKSLMSQIRSTASDWTAMNPSAATGVSNNTVVNLTVKASAGVDTKKTGQDIVAIVNKYATSSGGGGTVNRFI